MRKLLISFALLICFSLVTFAEEGMWLLNQLKSLKLAEKGMKVSATDIYNESGKRLSDAVVLLGGGTSEFVSSNGLLLTNHHVAFGAVQRASTKGTDMITTGFLARSYKDEIEAPGYSASVLQSMKDITDQFKKFDKIKDLTKRQRAIDLKIKKITEKIEKGKTDIAARVAANYSGGQYLLYVYKRYDDVRAVYIPPLAIGNYGGEVDNWMWPRHTGDFSFMRVYMAPDGSGRKFHKDNVPYKPKSWFKLPSQPLKAGDMTFIMGFPGRTKRFRTSYTVAEYLNHGYPKRIKLFKELIDLNSSFEKDSTKAAMKVAGLIKGLGNGMKNNQGMIDGMKRSHFLEKKIKFEKKLMAFLKKDDALFKKYGNVLADIEKMILTKGKYRDQMLANFQIARIGGTALSTAIMIYDAASEKAKPKKKRDPEFSEKKFKRAVSKLQYRYMSQYVPAHKAMLVRALEQAKKLSKEQQFKGLDYIFNDSSKTIKQFVDEIYKETRFTDAEKVKPLASKKIKQLNALKDPFLILAGSIYKDRETIKERNRKFDAKLENLRRKYIEALRAWKGNKLYPDANRDLRFSLGEVEGYSPRDAVYYTPFTYIKGMLDKDTGKKPFDMPSKLKEIYKKGDFGQWADPKVKDVPIAFTHKVDSTGGSSGSPVLNAKGEIVGILFDGNYESMTGDWEFDESLVRSISVDIRYVMFIVEKLAGADNILKEMGVR